MELIEFGIYEGYPAKLIGMLDNQNSKLMEYFCNPLYMIYDFISDADFITGGKRNPAYFILNLILGLVISIFSCVYNEFLILFLQKDY